MHAASEWWIDACSNTLTDRCMHRCMQYGTGGSYIQDHIDSYHPKSSSHTAVPVFLGKLDLIRNHHTGALIRICSRYEWPRPLWCISLRVHVLHRPLRARYVLNWHGHNVRSFRCAAPLWSRSLSLFPQECCTVLYCTDRQCASVTGAVLAFVIIVHLEALIVLIGWCICTDAVLFDFFALMGGPLHYACTGGVLHRVTVPSRMLHHSRCTFWLSIVHCTGRRTPLVIHCSCIWWSWTTASFRKHQLLAASADAVLFMALYTVNGELQYCWSTGLRMSARCCMATVNSCASGHTDCGNPMGGNAAVSYTVMVTLINR